MDADKVGKLFDLLGVESEPSFPSNFNVKNFGDKIVYYNLDIENAPKIIASIVIRENFTIEMHSNGNIISPSKYSHICKDNKIKRKSDVANLIAFLKTSITDNVIDFLEICISNLERLLYTDEYDPEKIVFFIEQLKYLKVSKNHRRYSFSLIQFSYIVSCVSPRSYKTILDQNVLTLPSQKYLSNLTKKVRSDDNLAKESYLNLRVTSLNSYERFVVLIIDEIYVANKMEYSNGKFFGLKDGSFISTILCFMVRSCCGKFRDVVGMYPIVKLNVSVLNSAFDEVMSLVHKSGLQVVCMSVDNHPVKRSCYKQLGEGEIKNPVTNPFFNDQSLSLIFDPTHNIKNIYNNFQRRGVFVFPNEDSEEIDRFSDVFDLHELEKDKPVKIATKLNKSTFNPKNIQRTSVKLALSVFHETTEIGLKFYNNPEWQGTIIFLQKIIKFWKILNVKSPNIGQNNRDLYRDPVRSINDWKLDFLEEMQQFFYKWSISSTHGLSKETFLANMTTCKGLIECTKYLLGHCEYNYVLLGHFQSDPLESRFGWYRQMSGGNYYISAKQLMKSKTKIKTLSLIKLSGVNIKNIDIEDPQIELIDNNSEQFSESISLDIFPDEADLNLIFYIAGYISHSLTKNKFEACLQILISDHNKDESCAQLTDLFNRGGLDYPSGFCFVISLVCWEIFSCIKNNSNHLSTFLSFSNQFHAFLTSTNEKKK